MSGLIQAPLKLVLFKYLKKTHSRCVLRCVSYSSYLEKFKTHCRYENGWLRSTARLNFPILSSSSFTSCSKYQHLLYVHDEFIRLSKRDKSKKSQSNTLEEESDSDDETKSESPIMGGKIITAQVPSMRMDLIIKSAIGMARNKAEVEFYKGRIRVNGARPPKKSIDIKEGDAIDVIKELSEDNENLLVVTRIEILSVRLSGDALRVKMSRQRNLLIENYADDPWKPSDTSEQENPLSGL